MDLWTRNLVAEIYSQEQAMTSFSQKMIDFKFTLWSDRPVRTNTGISKFFARQAGGKASALTLARSRPLGLDLLALGSLLALLLIIARGAGAG